MSPSSFYLFNESQDACKHLEMMNIGFAVHFSKCRPSSEMFYSTVYENNWPISYIRIHANSCITQHYHELQILRFIFWWHFSEDTIFLSLAAAFASIRNPFILCCSTSKCPSFKRIRRWAMVLLSSMLNVYLSIRGLVFICLLGDSFISDGKFSF